MWRVHLGTRRYGERSLWESALAVPYQEDPFDRPLARYLRVCGLDWTALRALTSTMVGVGVCPTEHGQDGLQDRRLSDLGTLGRSFPDSQAVRWGGAETGD